MPAPRRWPCAAGEVSADVRGQNQSTHEVGALGAGGVGVSVQIHEHGVYETRLYRYDGTIMEEYALADAPYDPVVGDGPLLVQNPVHARAHEDGHEQRGHEQREQKPREHAAEIALLATGAAAVGLRGARTPCSAPLWRGPILRVSITWKSITGSL